MIPALRRDRMPATTLGYYLCTLFRFCHVTHNANFLIQYNFIMVRLRNGKQQFIIFPATQGTSRGVDFKFKGRFFSWPQL